MASSPIISWHKDRETMEKVTYFIFLSSKIIVDSDSSHEIKRCLLLGRKTMTNLDSILKNRDITLPAKVCIVKAMIFSSSHVKMWEFDYKEGWMLKNWCFRTGNDTWEFFGQQRSNQSILKEINPIHWKDWCWSWSSNTVSTWCEEPTH